LNLSKKQGDSFAISGSNVKLASTKTIVKARCNRINIDLLTTANVKENNKISKNLAKNNY